eukprot:15469545-Alexandrium_andersonii.AAC.1
MELEVLAVPLRRGLNGTRGPCNYTPERSERNSKFLRVHSGEVGEGLEFLQSRPEALSLIHISEPTRLALI